MTNTDLAGPGGTNPPPFGGTSVKEMAAAAVGAVKQDATDLVSAAGDKAGEEIQHHKEGATKTLGDFAAAIRRAGDDLAQHDQTMAGKLVKQGADGLEGLTRSLSDKSPGELLDGVRDFGRKNPVAFIAGAVLVGLAVGRFARSSEAPDPIKAKGAPDAVPPDPWPTQSRPAIGAGSTSSGVVAAAGASGAELAGVAADDDFGRPPFGSGV